MAERLGDHEGVPGARHRSQELATVLRGELELRRTRHIDGPQHLQHKKDKEASSGADDPNDREINDEPIEIVAEAREGVFGVVSRRRRQEHDDTIQHDEL